MGRGLQPALRPGLRGFQNAAAHNQRIRPLVRESRGGEFASCRDLRFSLAGSCVTWPLTRSAAARPLVLLLHHHYFCVITSSLSFTFTSPTYSGNLSRSRSPCIFSS